MGRGATVDPARSGPAPPAPTPTVSGVTALRSVQLPVPGTSWVTVHGDFPLTEEAWNQMIRLLEAMKPGLVAPEERATDEPDDD
jgi:hypothetical protein